MAQKQHFFQKINQFEKKITVIQNSKDDNQLEPLLMKAPQQDKECDEQIVHKSSPIISPLFVEQIYKNHHLFSKIQKKQDPQKINIELNSINNVEQIGRRQFNYYFRRNIQHLRNLTQIQRQEEIQKETIWPSIQQCKQKCQININDKRQGISITFQTKKADLLKLKKKKIVPPSIIINFFQIMKKMRKQLDSVQLVSFNFLSVLMAKCFDHQNYYNLNTGTKINDKQRYIQANKLLLQSLLNYEYNVIPFLSQNHYSMVIVKGASSLKKKKQSRVQIIYCSSRYTAKKRIFEQIREFLLFQLYDNGLVDKGMINKIHFIQLLLPKQVSYHDSGLYLMLYLETLLDINSVELDKLSYVQNRNKLHLFPRNLVSQMRLRIVLMYANLQKFQKEKDEENKIKTLMRYFEFKKECESKAVYNIDYDKLQKKEVTKLQYLLRGKITGCLQERFNFQLQYYYNKEFNYYEDQK